MIYISFEFLKGVKNILFRSSVLYLYLPSIILFWKCKTYNGIHCIIVYYNTFMYTLICVNMQEGRFPQTDISFYNSMLFNISSISRKILTIRWDAITENGEKPINGIMVIPISTFWITVGNILSMHLFGYLLRISITQ